MLGLQPYILNSANSSLLALDGTSTCASPPSTLHSPHPLSLPRLVNSLARPITTALFILQTSTSRRSSPLVSFAQVSLLEAAVWNLRVRLMSLMRGWAELRDGMERIEALYESESELEKVGDTTRWEKWDGVEGMGCKVEFRRVTARYEERGIAALNDVSFTIYPGQMWSVALLFALPNLEKADGRLLHLQLHCGCQWVRQDDARLAPRSPDSTHEWPDFD